MATDEQELPALDKAWAEVEAVLPEDWILDELTRLHGVGFDNDAWIAKAIFHDHNAGPLQIAVGPTPAAALMALRDKLVVRRFPAATDAARQLDR
jgi:hypothetical protein